MPAWWRPAGGESSWDPAHLLSRDEEQARGQRGGLAQPGLKYAGLGARPPGLAGRDGDGPADTCYAGPVLYVGLAAVVPAQSPEIRPREIKSGPTLNMSVQNSVNSFLINSILII
jgi:hypothetical protein